MPIINRAASREIVTPKCRSIPAMKSLALENMAEMRRLLGAYFINKENGRQLRMKRCGRGDGPGRKQVAR